MAVAPRVKGNAREMHPRGRVAIYTYVITTPLLTWQSWSHLHSYLFEAGLASTEVPPCIYPHLGRRDSNLYTYWRKFRRREIRDQLSGEELLYSACGIEIRFDNLYFLASDGRKV